MEEAEIQPDNPSVKAHVKSLTDVEPENYWSQIERLERLIRASELKAGIIFSFHSLVLGVFFDRLDELSVTFHNSTLFSLLVAVWLIIVIISIFYALQCFLPRMELRFEKNVFFFKDAIHQFGSVKEYSKKFMDTVADREELFDKLGQQIYIECKIVDMKFTSVKNSMKYLGISFIFVLLIIALWLYQLQQVL